MEADGFDDELIETDEVGTCFLSLFVEIRLVGRSL